MAKIYKAGRIVVVLTGKYAGRKAVVLRTVEDGTKDRKFGHALIAGVDRYPRKVVRAMTRKRLASRMRVTPFVKYVNFNHIMPTRYNLDSTVSDLLKSKVADVDAITDAAAKAAMLKAVKGVLEDRYKKLADPKAVGDKHTTGALYFFRKLRF